MSIGYKTFFLVAQETHLLWLTGPIIGGMTERSRRRYWNWLLVIPLLLLIYPGLYARSTPDLLGFPFFYWYQFVVVVATALLTGAVYWLTCDPNDK